MPHHRMPGRRLATVGVTIVLCFPHVLIAQHSKPKEQKEQSDFGIELEPAMERPVTLSREALDALSKDERVASCLGREGLSADKLAANWFVASEIHLDGLNERDLIVLPGDRLPETPVGEISPNACFWGANTAQMWVLRKTQRGFRIALSQIGHHMEVFSTRTNGVRDIRIGAVVAGYDNSIDYRSDGQVYKIVARTSELIGAELPTLSKFKVRKRFIQSPSQSSEPVRTQARIWLWKHWKEQKPAYLKLITHDKTVEETSSYFVGQDEEGKWQVTIQRQRIERNDVSGPQQQIVEKELLVASEVQRVEPTSDERQATHQIPADLILRGSKYRLQFLDDRWGTVASL